MPGPNLLAGDQGTLGAGSASVYELQGGRFGRQVGNSFSDMRSANSPANGGAFMWNTLCWFLGNLYWAGANNSIARVRCYDPGTDTWVEVYNSGASIFGVGGLCVVQTASGPYLVVSVTNAGGVIAFARTTDGTTWSGANGVAGRTATNSSPGNMIAHGGLVFLHMPGPPSVAVNRIAFDPVANSLSSFSPSGDTEWIQTGSFFKFDGRFFHIGGFETVAANPPAYFSEFAFGSWARRSFGPGYSGVQMHLGTAGGLHYSGKCAAVVVDDDTVLVFGTGDNGSGMAFKAYELTLSSGSGSSLVAADVSSTYDPGGLGGDLNNYYINNIGKGSDGFWYLAFANDDALTGLGLVRVVKGSSWIDAGAMGANTGYSMSLATLNGGERRDSRGSLPLVKPSPLSTSPGATGLVQSFRVDGDPLIALHGAVGGGPFVAGESVTWTGGSGVALYVGATELQMHTIVGVAPDGLLMTGGGSGATTTCSTSSGNGQAHTARGLFFLDANSTGLGAPSPNAPSGYCTLVAGSGVNCTVSKGTGPDGSDEVVTDADGSGQVKSFEWDFLSDGVPAFLADNVKLQASRV